MRGKRRPYLLACISGIRGRILVIFSILQIPYAYSLCFILQTFVHNHRGKNYSDFNIMKQSEILATNCSVTTQQIEKALIHHVTLYVYFLYIKFLANPCTLWVRDLGFYVHKQFQTSFLVENSFFLQNSNEVCKIEKNYIHFFSKKHIYG
jgi:hypothetical protein